MNGVYSFPQQERLYYGRRAEEVIAQLSETVGWKRIFITTNQSLKDSVLVRSMIGALGAHFAGCFAGCAAHSPRESVVAGAEAARKAEADVLVAVGGGSVIDATKVMLACLWDAVDELDGLDRLKTNGIAAPRMVEPCLRMAAVPTTLSAAEFTHIAGVTDRRRGAKDIFSHPLFAPAFVVLNPHATLNTPG